MYTCPTQPLHSSTQPPWSGHGEEGVQGGWRVGAGGQGGHSVGSPVARVWLPGEEGAGGGEEIKLR